MRISDWSSDVCSSDLVEQAMLSDAHRYWLNNPKLDRAATRLDQQIEREREEVAKAAEAARIENERRLDRLATSIARRSEEHTSELQSLMRISYAVFCLKKKKRNTHKNDTKQEEEKQTNR